MKKTDTRIAGELKSKISQAFESINKQLPVLEQEALLLIKEKSTDIKRIEYYLDTLYSFHISGFKITAQAAIIDYLFELNPEIARWHKVEFEKTEDDFCDQDIV